MRIQKILSQHRRDFKAIYECEYCGHTKTDTGYDDSYFHMEVIPNMKCSECEKTASESYVARETKYPDGMQV